MVASKEGAQPPGGGLPILPGPLLTTDMDVVVRGISHWALGSSYGEGRLFVGLLFLPLIYGGDGSCPSPAVGNGSWPSATVGDCCSCPSVTVGYSSCPSPAVGSCSWPSATVGDCCSCPSSTVRAVPALHLQWGTVPLLPGPPPHHRHGRGVQRPPFPLGHRQQSRIS